MANIQTQLESHERVGERGPCQGRPCILAVPLALRYNRADQPPTKQQGEYHVRVTSSYEERENCNIAIVVIPRGGFDS